MSNYGKKFCDYNWEFSHSENCPQLFITHYSLLIDRVVTFDKQ